MRRKSKKNLVHILVITMFIISTITYGNIKQAKAQETTVEQGSSVYFGRYMQNKVTDEEELETLKKYTFADNKLNAAGANYVRQDGKYYKDAPIEWQVLRDEGDCYSLISKKILAVHEFDDWGDPWETCTLRTWLNENFLQEAFTEEEQKQIEETTLSNIVSEWGTGNNPYYPVGDPEEVITKDKVFLLAYEDVQNSLFGFEAGTDAAKSRVAYKTQYVDDEESVASYWLRGPMYWYYGNVQERYVTSDGSLEKWFGTYSYGVRPVIRVRKDATGLSTTKPEEKGVKDSSRPTSFACKYIPSLSGYEKKLDYYYILNSLFYKKLSANTVLNGTSFPIPGLITTNTINNSNGVNEYVNNDTYVPQGICRMGKYILISAYQETYKKNMWKAEYNSVIYVVNGSTFEYITTLVLPNTYHNGGIAFDGYNVWLTNSKNKAVYYIKKEVIENKIPKESSSRPYSFMINESELGKSYRIENTPSCLTYHDGKLWVGTYGGNGQIYGYMLSETSSDEPILTNYKPDTITAATIVGMSAAAAKCINGIEFDGSDLYISVSSGRQGVSKHIIRAKKVGNANIGSSYKVVKKVVIPDMSEEMLIEGDILYCVFESGANHYNGTYGKGPSIVTERVLAFDKKLWEE